MKKMPDWHKVAAVLIESANFLREEAKKELDKDEREPAMMSGIGAIVLFAIGAAIRGGLED